MSGPEDVLAGRRVLVIEDDALLAMELTEELQAIGVVPIGPVMTFASALQAVKGETQIDAALMNVNLRGEVSFPIADALAERGVPFLFVTETISSSVSVFQKSPAIRNLPTCRP